MSETIRMPQTHLAALAVEKAYRKAEHKIPVLRGVNVEVLRGEFISIVGQSGSGKSTLLHLLELRNRVFGFIFQFYHLLPELSVVENVLAPQMIRYSMWEYWKRRRELTEQAKELLDRVGLGHRLTHKPSELSGGEMQRAAIARALVGNPEVLLADEPTGNLDAATGREIMDLLASLNAQNELTIIMVTHDESIAKCAHRIVKLAEGRLQSLSDAA
jgi:lipoprotein-releasing system ATP-binding protein